MSALQKGETVLITGGTGWIGSHIVDQALAAGLKAKLAIRSEAKAKTLIEAMEKKHGKGHIETVIVPDFGAEHAYDEAVKGVHGIIHAASDLTFSGDWEKVIPPVLKAYRTLLEATANQKDIRRLVLTSSSAAVGMPNPGGKETQHFDVDVWNQTAVDQYKSTSEGYVVYAASKALSEKAAWDFMKEKKPSFVLNTVNPNANFGSLIPGIPAASTGSWMADAAEGKDNALAHMPSQFHIDVDDVAKLHVIALTREDVKNERILAFGDRFTYNDIIDIIKKVKPDAKTVPKEDKYGLVDNTTVNVDRANELLKDQGGLRNLEYSVRRNLGL